MQVDNFASGITAARSMRDALIDIANANYWGYSIGPEMWDDDGKFHHIPVDLMIYGTV